MHRSKMPSGWNTNESSWNKRPSLVFNPSETEQGMIILCIFVPSSSMEVFASHLGSVESLRKAKDVPGNSTSYRNLHCSICARVKTMNPSSKSTLSSRLQAPICDNLSCTATFSCSFNLRPNPTPNPACRPFLTLQTPSSPPAWTP